MTILIGQCHCGNLRIRFETNFSSANLPLRACQCSFCRAHGAVTATDPRGRVSISASDPTQVLHYRFGLGITDFLICACCGAFVAAIVEIAGSHYASINTNTLTAHSQLQMPIQPVDYEGETRGRRRARRKQHWTPAAFDGHGLECRSN